MAVSQALTVIFWQENLLPEEMPPEWMWTLPEQLDEWFEEVEHQRDERFGRGRGRDDMQDAPDMMENALAAGRRR